MNHLFKFLVLFVLTSLTTLNSFAEKQKIKFGKVSQEELDLNQYPLDTSAVAVILHDYGYSYFEYENNDSNSGFVCKFERHVRIKILKSEGFDYANFEIPTFHNKYGKEEVTNLKARTFNFDKKIISTKLEKSQIFKEKTTPNWNLLKFTLPNIKVGSVIDCKYTIKSPFYQNFRTWQFQYNIPVVYSKYRTQIPEYFNYQKTVKGYYPVHEENLGNKRENILVEYKQMSKDVGSSKMERHKFTLNPTSSIYEFWGEDIPAFKSESYMLANKNYMSRIEFELESYQIENGTLHRFSSTWNTVKEKLIDSENFGIAIKKIGFTKNILSEIVSPTDSKQQKIAKIYQTVQNQVKWNELNRLFTSDNLKTTWKNKKGNSADINLLLVALLRGAEITANPVVLSTRDNGIIHPSHPTITQMNYVVACAEVEGVKYLMDATDPYCPIGILPFRCLNEKGRLISEHQSEWIDLNPSKGSKINLMANLKITEEGSLKGNIKEVYYDYEGSSKRKNIAIKSENSIENLASNYEEWNISESKILNTNNIYKPLIHTYSVDVESYANIENDRIYLNPILKYQTTENPFKMDKREYPVHFGHPIQVNYLLILEIPKDYHLDEQPEPSLVKLPENSGSYSYRITLTGNKLMANFKFNINKTHFLPDEYELIKEFYNQVISKENQMLILKKNDITAQK